MVVAMFSGYCEDRYTGKTLLQRQTWSSADNAPVEPVKIVSEHNGQTRITPSLTYRKVAVEVDYLNQCCGLSETPESICKLLTRMSHTAQPTKDASIVEVTVPPTRADVLHPCDIVSADS